MGGLRHEVILEVFYDAKGELCGHRVSGGAGSSSVSARYRHLFEHAFRMQAKGFVLVHNHPSGDPAPSSADVQMTRQIADIAKPLGITVHDHIIVGKSTHTSLRGMKLF